MLEINNLVAKTDDQLILQGLSLKILAGEIHAIMGPNGAGKSTLAKILAGHPAYEVLEGQILFHGKDLLDLDPEERAHSGVFMSFQYPIEIAGVTNFQFLFEADQALRKSKGQPPRTKEDFRMVLDEKINLLGIDPQFIERNINEGFSGGEKKRNEILQMALLEPDLAILDETDSGLDIDAMKVVAHGILSVKRENQSVLLITHYQRLLNYIRPDVVHVMVDGRIVQSGPADLALVLEEIGYENLLQTAGNTNYHK